MSAFDFDFSPLYRTTVGFDRIAQRLDSAAKSNRQGNYPPYNIVMEDENHYEISIAVAGFTESELLIESEQGVLSVTGKKAEPDGHETNARQYLYRGIANRNFERKFQLAEHVEVSGAHMENGLLFINLFRRVPEAMKPKRIAIGSSPQSDQTTKRKFSAV